MLSPSRKLLKNTLLVIFSIFGLASTPAYTSPIDVTITSAVDTANNGAWHVSSFVGKWEDNISLLQSQIWWKDPDLGVLFALQIREQLGNNSGGNSPFMAYSCGDCDQYDAHFFYLSYSNQISGAEFHDDFNERGNYTFATAYRTSNSVPEPPTMGLMLGALFLVGLFRFVGGDKSAIKG